MCNNSCPYSPQSHFSSLLSSGPKGAVDLFIGSPMDLSGQDNGIYRLPLPSSVLTSAGNSTSTPNPIKGGLRTMKNNDKWLNVPEFVGTVEVDDFVYFFFREVAVEFSNCGRVVHSRVVRVCKNDLGGDHKSILDDFPQSPAQLFSSGRVSVLLRLHSEHCLFGRGVSLLRHIHNGRVRHILR